MLRYAITDGQFALGHQRHQDTQPLRDRLLAHAEALAAQRVDFFLLREPTLPAGELATLTRDLLAVLVNTPTRLLVHSRADVAAATHAPGVHLPSAPGTLTPGQVRTVYSCANRPPPVISLSCHNREDLERARILLPDLILFGPIFGKEVRGTPIHPPIGLEPLRAACTFAAPIPVLALGGITHTNTPLCLEAGAAGIAAIRLFSTPSTHQLK